MLSDPRSAASRMAALLGKQPPIAEFEAECDRILEGLSMAELASVAVVLNAITTDLALSLVAGAGDDARAE